MMVCRNEKDEVMRVDAIANGRICCFTGYRPHRFGFAPDGLRPEQVQAALGEQIRRLYDDGVRTFITGMCVGVDLWAADEVLALMAQHKDVSLVAAVPFEGQESHWPAADRRHYRTVLGSCTQVEVLFSAEEAKRNAAKCYRKRNEWMVDQADTVLAVYTAADPEPRSGTAATVRYARRQWKRIVYIHPSTLAIAEEMVEQMQFMAEGVF